MSLLSSALKKELVPSDKNLDKVCEDVEKSNKLLFVTGRAGTGKSTLLKVLCSGTKKNFVVLAPTGIAAVNVGGETIHSFFRFKPGITYDEAERYGERSDRALYTKLELLIIDDVSMVRADLMDCIDIFLRKARKIDYPFGGVQVVLFGDLYQLEPIVRGEERDALYSVYDSAYFFSSKVFQQLLSHPQQSIEFVELQKVHRQKDADFINLLDKIRKRKISEYELEIINDRYREQVSDTMQDYIYLTTTNAAAQGINIKNLNILPGEEWTFIGSIEGQVPKNNLPTDWEIKLKLNARVMLLNNDSDKRWINGTIGYVSRIEGEEIYIQLEDGHEYLITPYVWSYHKYFYDREKKRIEKELIGSFTQYPIKLAWAITIHKSQGQTFDKSIIWLEGRAFANGQVYVALSRCRTLEGIMLNRPIRQFDIMTDDKVKRFLVKIKKYIVHWKLPIEEKQKILARAIKHQTRLIVDYITVDDEETRFHIEPLQMKEEENDFFLSCVIDSMNIKTLRLEQIIAINQAQAQLSD